MWEDFKTFVARGNMFDLAVGIVIGAAFGTVVNSFVKDVLMPPIGMLTGGIDFSNLYWNLSGQEFESLAAAQEAGAPLILYGTFINNVISFLIVGFALFLLVKQYQKLQQKEAEAPPPPTEKECPHCRMSVPIAATKCGHCTSGLEAPEAA